MGSDFTIALSPLDEGRFGVISARALILNLENLDECQNFCQEHAVRMLVARCSTESVNVAQALEARGARLMDCLVYYERNVIKRPFDRVDAGRIVIRPLHRQDVAAVESVGRRSFSNYYGHYHADPRLDRERANEGYANWSARVCTDPSAADVVLVAISEEILIGFVALKRVDQTSVEIVLNAVDPAAQGMGVYNALFQSALQWASKNGAQRCFVSTQVNNIAVQKVWVRNGMEPAASQYTFHLWYD